MNTQYIHRVRYLIYGTTLLVAPWRYNTTVPTSIAFIIVINVVEIAITNYKKILYLILYCPNFPKISSIQELTNSLVRLFIDTMDDVMLRTIACVTGRCSQLTQRCVCARWLFTPLQPPRETRVIILRAP